LLGVLGGGHAFLRWLYAATGQETEPRRWPWKWTIKLVGLVVLLFVAGVAVTGVAHQTGWLIRSPEPLTQGNRDAHPRTISASNLKQMTLAAHTIHDEPAVNRLPRSTFDATGRPFHSWQTDLLPYIEQGSLHNRIDHTKPWTHANNSGPMTTQVGTFLHPNQSERDVNGFAVSHYAGNVHVVLTDTPKKLSDFPTGTSNTIFAGEVDSGFRAWGDPMNVRDPRSGAEGLPDGFGGPRGKPAQFAMLDGSVRTFDPKALADLAAGKVPE
jgi:hypothetical protein